MTGDIPKRVKRLLREYASAAHEEELRRALLALAEAFKRWEHGDLDSGELSDLIHRFHQGPARGHLDRSPPRFVGFIFRRGKQTAQD